MRNIIRFRRLLSLLLCLAMFLSLGFTAYAEPVGTIEAAEGQIRPVEDASPEAGALPNEPSNVGEDGDFTLEAQPILVESKGLFSFIATMRELTFGPVMWETGDDVGTFLPDKFQLHLYGGEVIDGKGNTIDVLPADSDGGFDITIICSHDFVESDPIPMGVPLYGFISSNTWEHAQPGIYSGAYQYRGAWLGKIAGEDDVVYTELRSIPMTVYIPDPDADYEVQLQQSQGGTLTADKTSAKAGETVTITAAPDPGCALQEPHVTDLFDREIACRRDGNTFTFTMPRMDVKVSAKWLLGWSTLQSMIDQAADGAVIKLEQDFKAAAGDTALVIPAGKRLSLDLNGHVLDRNLSEAKANGNAITNNGTLTILDSGENGGIKGACSEGSGGAIVNNGTLTVEGGSFCENSAREAGAIFNPAGSVLTVNGGAFYRNTVTTYGGGAVVNYGTMTMNDGSIYSNSVPLNGGGIWTAGSLTMTGGLVAENTAGQNGGGVYFKDGSFRISGDPAIYGNKGEGGTNNLYILENKTLTVTGFLKNGTRIGVRCPNGGMGRQLTIYLALNLDLPLSEAFFSDDDTLRCTMNDNGELTLATAIYQVKVDSDMQGGTVTPDKTRARQGETVNLTVQPDEGMKLKVLKYRCDGDEGFDEVYQNEDGSWYLIMPPYDLTVYAEFVPDVEEYPLKVCGIQVDGANKDNIFGDSGTPRATYDPETFTLTLNTATLPVPVQGVYYIYAERQDLNIVAEQAMTIDASENGYHPICVEFGNLSLSGSITIRTMDADGIVVYGSEENQGNLTVKGNLTVTAIDDDSPYYTAYANGILVTQNVTIPAGGSITARSETSTALLSSAGVVRVLGGTLSVASTANEALECGGLELRDGTITAEGQGDDPAVSVSGDATVSGGSLTSRNGETGICVQGNMTVSGGTLLASGEDYGISVYGTLSAECGIESITGEGGRHAILADRGILLDPYILVREPAGAELNENGTEFVLPGSDERLTRVVLATDPTAPTFYRVILDDSIPAGSVTADKTRATEGESVTLTVTDLAGGKLFAEYVNHKLETVSVHDLKQVDGNTWTFTMPENDVTVSIQYTVSAVYPNGKTGIQMLTLLAGDHQTQEGDDEIYARAGETVTVQMRLEHYFTPNPLILEYEENGSTVTKEIPVSYNANSGSYDASFSMPRAAATVTVTADTSRPWMVLQAQINAAGNGAVIALFKDTVAENSNTALMIPADKNITLDLAGFTLDRGLAESAAAAEGNVITVKGTLTLIDSSAGKTGLVTGGNNTGSGGGIHNEGVLNLEGGAICGNATQQWGGGVYLAQNAKLNLSGGVIENNRCVNNGGGIHISESATLNVSGDPAVTGNRKGEDLQNVNLANGALIHVTGKLENARIGVSVSSNSVPTAESPRLITTGLSGNGTGANFFSDDEDFYVWVIDGEAHLLVQDLSRDINMDGKVNALDLLVLRKKLVELPIEGSFDPEAADLNKDGKVDILDLVRLRKILGQ